MSVLVMNDIWRHSKEKGSRLLLLLAIADNANDAGVAWPSISTLAQKTRMSERQVQRMVQGLVADGALLYEPGNGRGHTHKFFIPPQTSESDKPRQPVTVSEPIKPRQDVTDYQTKRVTSETERVTSCPIKGDIAMSPEPSIEPSKEKPKTVADKPPPAPRAKAFDPRIRHPAIQAVRLFIHCLPDEQNRDEVIEALGDEPDKPKLAECYRVWKRQGWNKVSLVPALDWYVNGIPEKFINSNGRRHEQRRSNPKVETILDYDYSGFDGAEGEGARHADSQVPSDEWLESAPARRPDGDDRRMVRGTRH